MSATTVARGTAGWSSHHSPAAWTMPTVAWPQMWPRTGFRRRPSSSSSLGELAAQAADERAHRAVRRRVLGAGAVDEEGVQVPVRGDGREVGVDRRPRPLADLARPPEGGAYRVDQQAGVPLGERLVQAALVAEVPVEDRFGDARLSRDRGHRHVGPLTADDAVGGVEQGTPPARITPRRRRRHRFRRWCRHRPALRAHLRLLHRPGDERNHPARSPPRDDRPHDVREQRTPCRVPTATRDLAGSPTRIGRWPGGTNPCDRPSHFAVPRSRQVRISSDKPVTWTLRGPSHGDRPAGCVPVADSGPRLAVPGQPGGVSQMVTPRLPRARGLGRSLAVVGVILAIWVTTLGASRSTCTPGRARCPPSRSPPSRRATRRTGGRSGRRSGRPGGSRTTTGPARWPGCSPRAGGSCPSTRAAPGVPSRSSATWRRPGGSRSSCPGPTRPCPPSTSAGSGRTPRPAGARGPCWHRRGGSTPIRAWRSSRGWTTTRRRSPAAE